MRHLGIKEIEEIIPHRHPFLLVVILKIMSRENMRLDINVYPSEKNSFRDIFHRNPVMPGVLTVEALAQTGAVAILSKEENKGKIAYFGGIQKCRFKGKVVPGDKSASGDQDYQTERTIGSR